MNFNLRALNRAHARGSRTSGGAGASAPVALDERLPRRSRTEQLIERATRECERRAKYVGRLQVREHQCLRAEMGTNYHLLTSIRRIGLLLVSLAATSRLRAHELVSAYTVNPVACLFH